MNAAAIAVLAVGALIAVACLLWALPDVLFDPARMRIERARPLERTPR